ncbi:hypothetical protein XI02_13920 [Bradyrhizobium sp. CCBAU 21365]|uniref:hypothetical protein n=1 Tax=Bradyrhizobium sp. CCBAU 21365 TaxID=1325083 RepID=UPI00188B0080|nr:hypothetical protein [Bradyrhizobium sp. CCBAU 21365]QOZ15954.1 hypothetical protein XI02_13920 [Bradyrhizobium sp. CCBAU 21365]
MQEFGIYLTAGTIIAGIIAIVGISRKFSTVESSATESKKDVELLEARIENLTRDLQKSDRDGVLRLDVLRQETGEMGAALRQKIHEVEMNSRDRIDEVAAGIRESIEKLGDRLEGKIDRALQRRDS